MNDSAKPLQKVLAEIHWLHELPEQAKERVYADAHVTCFGAGDVVVRKGERAKAWIGVAEGLLKVSTVHRSGKVVMFSPLVEGSWGGEGSVLNNELFRYDIFAMRPSRVVFLPGTTFRWLLETSLEFNRVIVARLNARLGYLMSMMETDRITEPVVRVARVIGTMYNPVLFPNLGALLTLSQTELGELIGMSRQSINAALQRLESEGLVSVEYGGVFIKSFPGLVNYAERD